MTRPLVLAATDIAIAMRLGRDFRWPVVDQRAALALVEQGFSVVCMGSLTDCDADVIELDGETDIGAAHIRIAAARLDPLKLNVDMGVFGWCADGAGRVLFVRQAYGAQLWGLPGGEIQLFEAPDAAVVREIAEETGYEARAEKLIAVYGRRQHIGLYFACMATGGEPRTEWDSEVADIGWFEPSDPPAPVSPVIGLLRSDLAGGETAARFF